MNHISTLEPWRSEHHLSLRWGKHLNTSKTYCSKKHWNQLETEVVNIWLTYCTTLITLVSFVTFHCTPQQWTTSEPSTQINIGILWSPLCVINVTQPSEPIKNELTSCRSVTAIASLFLYKDKGGMTFERTRKKMEKKNTVKFSHHVFIYSV